MTKKTKAVAKRPAATPAVAGAKPPEPNVLTINAGGELIRMTDFTARDLCGCGSETFAMGVLTHADCTVPDGYGIGRNKSATFAVEALVGIAPKTPLEGLIAAQMVASHNAAMELMRRGLAPNQDSIISESRIDSAVKLLRAFGDQVEILQKIRGKTTRQTVIVEHVHVNEGGQAIVGPVAGGGGV